MGALLKNKMAPMVDDDGPPPLEDCSDQLSGARARREAKEADERRHKEWTAMQEASASAGSQSRGDSASGEAAAAVLRGGRIAKEAKAAKEQEAEETRATSTCGFKKGFFDAPKPKAKKKASKGGEIEVLRPKEKPKPKGYIEEVAEAPTIDVTANQISNVLEMKDKPAEQWMSPQLMQSIMSDRELLMGFQDPEIQKLMDEISKDPTAIEKHRSNKKLMKFYERYIKFASSQFSKK